MTALDRLYLTLASPSAYDDGPSSGMPPAVSRSGGRGEHDDGAAVANAGRDAELLNRLRADDELAFESLFDAYWEPLCRHAARILHSTDGARDIVQEVLLRLWAQRQTLQVRTSLRAYLYGAVRNHALHQVGHAAVAQRAVLVFTELGESPGMAGHPMAADEAAARQELAAALDQALATLPPRVQQVASLKWGDGLGRVDIAQVLGISPFTVDKQIAAALRTLRLALAEFLGAPAGSALPSNPPDESE